MMIVCLLISCNTVQKEKQASFADEKEMNVIDIMDCWNSVAGENQMTLAVFENDKKKRSKIMDKWLEYKGQAEVFGRKALANDTVFISCIRADSIYKSFLEDRSLIAKSLMKFRKSVPIFSDNIEKIRNQIIEYNYFNGSRLGIYTDSYIKESSFSNQSFYSSLGDLFKEAYIHDSTSNVSDKDIVTIDSLLKRIDAIDRHVWAVPYYYKSKQKLDEKNAKLKMEKAKQQKLDSLTKQ